MRPILIIIVGDQSEKGALDHEVHVCAYRRIQNA
jgi:hypothetical protein